MDYEDGEYENSSFAYYEDYYFFDFDVKHMFYNELCSYETVTKFGSIAIPIVFTIVVLLSLIGNILVLVILGLCENLRSLTNIFILNLALSDLIFTLGLPMCVIYYIWSWTFGDFMCKAMNFIFSAGFYSSIVFLMLMSIQRYIAVVHPLSDWNKRQRFAVILILGWTFSFAAALPDLLFSKVKVNSALSKKHYCEFNNIKAGAVFTYQQNILFAVAFSVMGFCYIRIIQTVLRSRTNNRHRTRRLIFCIVVVFFVGWAPYNIVIFLRTFTDHQIKSLTECDVSSPVDYAFYVCKLLAFSHCFLNPVLYVFVGVKFRNHLRKLLQKIFKLN